MLNCHAYTRRGPFASRGDDFYLYGVDDFNDILRTLLPMLPQHREGILIIHGRPNRRVTGFQSLRRKTLAGLTPYILLNPDTLGYPSLVFPASLPKDPKDSKDLKALKKFIPIFHFPPLSRPHVPQSVKLPPAAVAPAA